MKKQFRTAMLSTACMLVVAVMSLTGVTYAWFTAGTDATVNGMSVTVTTTAGGIEVREKMTAMTTPEEGGEATETITYTPWANQLDLNVNRTGLDALSSKDGINFFDIEFDPASYEQAKISAINRDSNLNVIVKNIQVQYTGTDANLEITLDGSEITQRVGSNDIYKAARVAIIIGNTSYIMGAEAGDSAQAFVQASGDTFIKVNQAVEGYTATTTTVAANAIPVTLPKAVLDENGTTTCTPVDITIVIWLEGQDSNCVNGNAGGSFDVALKFGKPVAGN